MEGTARKLPLDFSTGESGMIFSRELITSSLAKHEAYIIFLTQEASNTEIKLRGRDPGLLMPHTHTHTHTHKSEFTPDKNTFRSPRH